MSMDNLISYWRDVRKGFIDEVKNVPADRFDFRVSDETRSIAELVRHIIETQYVLVGEVCRLDTNLQLSRFPEMIQQYAPGIKSITDKDELVSRLSDSMNEAEAAIRACGESGLNQLTAQFDGKQATKLSILNRAVAHEMYHRGQFTVYERLLKIEPVLTSKIKKIMTAAP